MKSYLTNIKGSTASMAGYTASLQGNITGLKKISSAISQYNALHESGLKEQTAFSAAVSTTNSKLGSYLTGLKGAEASLCGYVLSLASVTVKTVALQAATIALNAALSMGISFIVSSVVSAISNWIHKTENLISASEEAIEKVKSLNEEMNRNQKTISDSAKRFAELAQGVDQLTGKNISLTNEEYEEFLAMSNQLAEIFPSLTRNYDESGNAIVQLSGNVDTIVGSLHNLIETQKELYNRDIAENLPTIFKGVVENSNQYETELKELENKRDAILQGLEEVSSESFNKKVQSGLNDKYFEIISKDLDEYSRLISDYQKILTDSDLKIDTVNFEPIWNGKFDNDGKQILTYKTSIYIESSDEDIEHAKKIIDDKTEDLADKYEKDISALNEKIKKIKEKNKSNWSSLSSSIFAWLSTDDSFKIMTDNMQATIQNIVNNLDWCSLDFSSWNDAKQYIQDNILSLFDTKKGKETLDDIQLMLDIKTQFNNDDISINEYQGKLQEFMSSIEGFSDDTRKSIMWLFGIEINEDNTTTSDIDNLINNVKGKLQDKFNDKVGELTLDELKIAAEQIEVEEGTLLSWDVLIAKIKEVQDSSINSSTLSLDEVKNIVNGFKNGDTEIIGLIEEYELLQEVLSDTGNIQEETYEKLLSCSAKYSTAIKTENGHITVNATKLKQVAKSRQMDTQEAIRQTLALKKQEWVQWNNNIDNYNGTLLENIEATYGDIDVLQQQITQYELLANSLDNALNAFENFKNAQSTEDQEMYNTAQEAFDILKGYSSDPENENYGKYNRDEFQEAAMLLMDNDTYKKALNTKDLEKYKKVIDDFVKSVEPLFDEKNFNSAANLFGRINEIMESDDIPEADVDWAQRLGISKEMFHALSQFGNQYDFNHKEIFESYQLNTLDEYQSLLSNVRTAQEALNECTNKTSNEYSYLSTELDEAKQKYSEFKNETADALENAYADFIHSGAKSKENFDDYLKQNLGFDDSDITGVIDVLLDKADTVKKNLENMPPDSTAYELYKKQLEDVNNLLESLGFDEMLPTENFDKMLPAESLNDRISQYKELIEKEKECKETLKTAKEGSDSYNEAVQELEHISQLMENLRAPLELEINSNTAELDSQILQLNKKLIELKESLQQASSSNEAYAIHMEMIGTANEKANLEEQKTDLEKTLKIITDSEEAFSDIEKIQQEIIEDKVFDIIANDKATPVLKELNELQLNRKSLYVDVIVNNPAGIDINGSSNNQQPNNTNPFAKYGIKADGTFNAFAQGTSSDVSIPKSEKALVNELGEEGLVRNGKLIPIKGGAQFINLKRGDIVFNHKQMEQLKKNGYTAGRGKLIGAHANGIFNAYAGTGTGTKVNLPNLKDVTANNWDVVSAKSSSKAATEAVEETAEEIEEASGEVFDWIENRIGKFQRKYDKWLSQAETALANGFINKYYKKAFKAEKKELNTYGKAYTRYMKEANAVGLDEKYAKKVRNGTVDIETIQDKELADKVQKYQEYYDKATESTASFVETAEKLYNLPLDKAAAKIEKFSSAIDLLDKQLENAIGSTAKNDLIDDKTEQEEKILNAYKKADKGSAKKLKKAGKNVTSAGVLNSPDVSAGDKKKIKNAVKNGSEINLSLFKEGSKAYNAAVKYNEALKANAQATYDLATAQEEYDSWLVEASKIKFDNVADDYDKRVQMLDHQMTALGNLISEIETAGKNVDKSYYESQKNITAQMLAQYQEEKGKLEENIQEIKAGTDEWYEAYDQIQQVSSSISECTKKTYELNNAINQLRFDLFEDISASIGRIITEQEFLQELFAHENMTDNETGSFTEAGIAKLGSLSASYYASKERADKDSALVKELQDVRDNGKQADGSYKLGDWEFNSLDDLQAKIDETYKTWQGDIKDTYNIESEIAGLMKEDYQAQLSLLKKLIDAKKEALDAEKDLHDYNKTINGKTKDITTIQKQIAAYSGDTSQEGFAKLQKLQKELAEKEEDLRETEYDRYISDQQDMLDKLYGEYEELITKKLEDFMTLVREGLGIANENTAIISDYMGKVAGDNGYTEETKGLFNGISGSISANAANIIAAITADKTANSGTTDNSSTSKTGLAHPEAIETTASNDLIDTSIGSQNRSSASTTASANLLETTKVNDRNIAKAYIKNHADKTEKDKSKFEAVNKRIYENASGAYSGKGRILEENELKTLAKKLGVTYDNGKKTGNLYTKLKSINFPGFKKGGVISVDDIEKQVKANGDDGIVSVRDGEGILTPAQTEMIQKFAENLPGMNQAANFMDSVPVPNYMQDLQVGESISRNMNNIVNIGNIALPNVTNYEEFKSQMLHDIQTEKKTGMLIRDVVGMNQIAGSGSLDKFRHRF